MPDAAPVTNTVLPASSFTRILPRASGHPRPKTPSVPGRHMTALASDWEACRMSASGTFETCQRTLKWSAYGRRPEVIGPGQNDANDTKRTFGRLELRRKAPTVGLEQRWRSGNEAARVHHANRRGG